MWHSLVKSLWNGAGKAENTSGWSLQPAISKRCSCFVNVICWRAVYPQEFPPHFFTLHGFSEDPNLSVFSASSRLEQGQDWGRSFKGFTEAITKGSFRNRSELTGKKQPRTVGRGDFFWILLWFLEHGTLCTPSPLSKHYGCGRHQHTAIPSSDEGAFLQGTFSP